MSLAFKLLTRAAFALALTVAEEKDVFDEPCEVLTTTLSKREYRRRCRLCPST